MTAKKKDPAANNGKNGAGAYPLLPLRKRAVPIIAIETADPQATQDSCVSILDADAPALSWDMVRGAQGINAAGKAWADENIDEAAKLTLLNITEALAWFRNNAPRRALLIIHNGHLLLKNPQGEPILSSIQATWNCRDVFAARGATLVMLAPQWKLPTELAQDVVVISEPVPTDADILKIIDSLNTDAEFPEETLKAIDRQKALDGLTGYLSAFSVRQSYSIALNNTGPDYAKLWELKVQSLRQTAGLEITLPKITFDDMAGNEGVKAIIRRHLAGTEAPRAILWLDEIEKMLAASGSDLSGTTQAVLEQYLFWTQSRKVKGFLLAGIP